MRQEEINLIRWHDYTKSAILDSSKNCLKIRSHIPKMGTDMGFSPPHVPQNKRNGYFERYGRRMVAFFRDNHGLWFWLNGILFPVDDKFKASLKRKKKLPEPFGGFGICLLEVFHPTVGRTNFRYWAGRLSSRLVDLTLRPFDFTAASMVDLDAENYDLIAFIVSNVSKDGWKDRVLQFYGWE